MENRIKRDVNFRIIHNTRRRVHHALNCIMKTISTKDILGIGIDTYRKWIEFEMTLDMNWKNINIDHWRPIYPFDMSNEKQLKERFLLEKYSTFVK